NDDDDSGGAAGRAPERRKDTLREDKTFPGENGSKSPDKHGEIAFSQEGDTSSQERQDDVEDTQPPRPPPPPPPPGSTMRVYGSMGRVNIRKSLLRLFSG
ncbi:unnamed protein product, partial [Sphacelaria rigidula]